MVFLLPTDTFRALELRGFFCGRGEKTKRERKGRLVRQERKRRKGKSEAKEKRMRVKAKKRETTSSFSIAREEQKSD